MLHNLECVHKLHMRVCYGEKTPTFTSRNGTHVKYRRWCQRRVYELTLMPVFVRVHKSTCVYRKLITSVAHVCHGIFSRVHKCSHFQCHGSFSHWEKIVYYFAGDKRTNVPFEWHIVFNCYNILPFTMYLNQMNMGLEHGSETQGRFWQLKWGISCSC